MRYPAYKDSGVEWLERMPEHWTATRLRRVLLSLRDGTHGTFTREVQGIPLLSAKNILNGIVNIAETESLISHEDYLEINRSGYLKVGDLLITIVGTIGRVAIFSTTDAVAFQRSVASLRFNPQQFVKYHFYQAQAPFFQAGLLSSANQSAQSGVYLNDLAYQYTLLPPLLEQRAIAAFLDAETARIDALVTRQEALIALLHEKRRALISHAVTKGLDADAPMRDSGVPWLGAVPAHWEVKAIKWLSSVQRGASPRPIDDPKYFDDEGEYAWVRIADVTASVDGYLHETTQRLSSLGSSLSVKLQPDALFLSIAGSVGKPCITCIKACIHDGFVYFPQLRENNLFLFYIFGAGGAFQGLGKLGTQLNLNTDTVGSIRIGVPPRVEQDAIVAFVEQETERVDTLFAKTQQCIALLRERRAALIAAAVTGQIDVRGREATGSGR